MLLMVAKFRLQKDGRFIEKVSKFKLFAVLWSRQPSEVENDRKRRPRDTANRQKALQELPELPRALWESSKRPKERSESLKLLQERSGIAAVLKKPFAASTLRFIYSALPASLQHFFVERCAH